MSDWQEWVGRREVRSDRVDAEIVRRWCATLDRDLPDDGTAPQGLHWCLCLPDARTEKLGPDGHPLRDEGPGSFLPPIPLPRRMWASSEIEFLATLRVGDEVERHSRIASVAEKTGGSGRLVFVGVEHITRANGATAVRELQSLVYREAAAPDAPLSPALGDGRFEPPEWRRHRVVVPDERLLFRFSALTFNSHRIHYDLPWARDVERYRGLVVHGPLTATLLLELVRRDLGDNVLTGFRFRGHSPAIAGEPLHLVIRGAAGELSLCAWAGDGRQVMDASART